MYAHRVYTSCIVLYARVTSLVPWPLPLQAEGAVTGALERRRRAARHPQPGSALREKPDAACNGNQSGAFSKRNSSRGPGRRRNPQVCRRGHPSRVDMRDTRVRAGARPRRCGPQGDGNGRCERIRRHLRSWVLHRQEAWMHSNEHVWLDKRRVRRNRWSSQLGPAPEGVEALHLAVQANVKSLLKQGA